MSREVTTGLAQELSKAARQPAVQAVLFDLDDTLFDHQASSRAGLVALRESFPLLASEPFDAFEGRYRIILEEVHLLVLSGELSPAAARARRFGRFLTETFSPSPDDIERAGTAYFTGFHASRRPVEGRPGAAPAPAGARQDRGGHQQRAGRAGREAAAPGAFRAPRFSPPAGPAAA
jgi:hypothetical protein